MDLKPHWDKLIGGVKNAVVDLIKIAIGFFIGITVAEHWYPPHGVYWIMTVFVVYLAYWVVLLLLQRAWSRWRTAQKGPT
jgi:hypothetical protein